MIRPELLEVLARRALTEDAARLRASTSLRWSMPTASSSTAASSRPPRTCVRLRARLQVPLIGVVLRRGYGLAPRRCSAVAPTNRLRELTAYAQAHSTALNVARHFEIDDVIDPAETRRILAQVIGAAARDGRLRGSGLPVDTW